MFGDKEKQKNPAKAFFEFSSSKKGFVYYDKESKKDVHLPLPAHLVILDQLHTVSGFVEQNQSGAFGTEVRDIGSRKIRVRTFKKGVDFEGYWNDIKGECKTLGIKYTKSLYCLYRKPDGNYSIINIKLAGGANNAWIDSSGGVKDKDTGQLTAPPKFDARKDVVVISDQFEDRKKGNTEYIVPVFNKAEMNDGFREKAIEAVENELRPYLEEYLSGNE
jgi:hypothetical protein